MFLCTYKLYIFHSDCNIEGPYGSLNTPFHELFDNCSAKVVKIAIGYGEIVVALQITYRLSDGQEKAGATHGNPAFINTAIDIDLDGGEEIVGYSGYTNNRGLINQLAFVTNHGKIIGPYGKPTNRGGLFHGHCHIHGIFGAAVQLQNSDKGNAETSSTCSY